METTHELLYSHKLTSWAYLQVLFESLFSLTELEKIVILQDFEVMLG
jgi:hypothetical protein